MRPIDADKLIFPGIPVDARIMKAINNAPTVDAVPVVRGEWFLKRYDTDNYYAMCSICETNYLYYEEYNYCPNCGTKMREGMGG